MKYEPVGLTALSESRNLGGGQWHDWDATGSVSRKSKDSGSRENVHVVVEQRLDN